MSSYMLDGPKKNVFLFIQSFVKEHGYPPTVRDICAGLGYSSTSTVQTHLDNLREMGFIEGEGRRLKLKQEEVK